MFSFWRLCMLSLPVDTSIESGVVMGKTLDESV